MNVSDIPDELQDQFYNHQNHSSALNVFQKMALSQSVAEPGGRRGYSPKCKSRRMQIKNVDQNANQDKYLTFSSFETVLCTGMD